MNTLRPLLLAACLTAAASAQTPSPPAAPASAPDVVQTVAEVAHTAARLSETARWASAVRREVEAAGPLEDGDALVLLSTPDGVRAVPVTDEPLRVRAALVVYANGGWSLRTLVPGDVPSDEARRPFPALRRLSSPVPPRPPVAPRPPAEIIDIGSGTDLFDMGEADIFEAYESQRVGAVTFSVSGAVAGDAAPFLVALSQADGLRSLSASEAAGPPGSAEGQTRVEASFRFGSVAEWARWRAQPATRALLAPLAGGGERMRTRLDADRTGR